jgi:hypothetical protein
MKRLRYLALLAPVLLPAVAPAQSGRTPPPSGWHSPPPPRIDKPKPAARSCAEFGAGFVRLEGSDTCVRIGGQVSIGTAATRSAR